jgi:predicted dehydrogenase
MTRTTSLTRRGFLKGTAGLAAAAVAAPMIIPSRVFGANERITIGYIAMGRRARQLFDLPKDQTQIVAVSDVYKARMDEFVSKPVGKDCKAYQDYRELLADKGVDAIITATPDHWHALVTIHACQAGKDVYVEKPLSLTIAEGRAMVQAARKYERIVQVGSQQRSLKECRLGCEIARSGRLGKIHTVHGANYPSPWECDLGEQPLPEGLNWDVWCGQTEPRPYHEDLYLPRAKPGWISFRPYSGGEMTGWGAHGLDIIQWGMGMDNSGPVEVEPEGEGLKCPVTMRYADGTVVHLDGKGPDGGGLFIGDKGQVTVDRGKCIVEPESLGKDPIGPNEVHLYESNDHLGNWIDCIRSRKLPAADVEIGHRSCTMCHLGNIARWTGRKLTWDPAKEQFVNDDNANTYIQRAMRAPYQIPEVI